MGWVSRLRHSRGFGVHSPFAFRMITECLCLDVQYCDSWRLENEIERLQYRVAAFLQPSDIQPIGDADIQAALLACPPRSDRKLPVWVCAPRLTLQVGIGIIARQALTERIKPNTASLLFGADKAISATISECLDSLGHGIIFTNCRGTILACAWDGLPRQNIDLNF